MQKKEKVEERIWKVKWGKVRKGEKMERVFLSKTSYFWGYEEWRLDL